MPDAIKLILLSAFAGPAVAGCSDEVSPDQNVVITENVPADADIEALPTDEGGPAEDNGSEANTAHAY